MAVHVMGPPWIWTTRGPGCDAWSRPLRAAGTTSPRSSGRQRPMGAPPACRARCRRGRGRSAGDGRQGQAAALAVRAAPASRPSRPSRPSRLRGSLGSRGRRRCASRRDRSRTIDRRDADRAAGVATASTHDRVLPGSSAARRPPRRSRAARGPGHRGPGRGRAPPGHRRGQDQPALLADRHVAVHPGADHEVVARGEVAGHRPGGPESEPSAAKSQASVPTAGRHWEPMTEDGERPPVGKPRRRVERLAATAESDPTQVWGVREGHGRVDDPDVGVPAEVRVGGHGPTRTRYGSRPATMPGPRSAAPPR